MFTMIPLMSCCLRCRRVLCVWHTRIAVLDKYPVHESIKPPCRRRSFAHSTSTKWWTHFNTKRVFSSGSSQAELRTGIDEYTSPRLSSLYIDATGAANTAFVYLDLNLAHRLADLSLMVHDLETRQIAVDVYKLADDYRLLMEYQDEKLSLEEQRRYVSKSVADFIKEEKVTKDTDMKSEISKKKQALITEGRAMRDKLKIVDHGYHALQKTVTLNALQLPSEFHSSAPVSEEIMKHENEIPLFTFPEKDHINIGRTTNTLHFRRVSPTAYYLSGELAHMERTLCRLLTYQLSLSAQLISAPDMFRTFVVEACGIHPDDTDKVFLMESKPQEIAARQPPFDTDLLAVDTMLLSGVSPMSFAAYLTRMRIHEESLPLKLFACGRHYSPDGFTACNGTGLLAAQQATTVELFGVAQNERQSEDVYRDFCDMLWNFYSQLDLPIRQINVARKDLLPSEAGCVIIEAWLPSLQRYVKVSDVKICNDYISRRLMMKCTDGTTDEQDGYLHTVHSTALSVPTLLAVIMENTQTQNGSFTVPELLKTNRNKMQHKRFFTFS